MNPMMIIVYKFYRLYSIRQMYISNCQQLAVIFGDKQST